MATINTDIAAAFNAKKRIRTMNHRGSLLITNATTDGSAFAATDNPINIMPIAFSTSIKAMGAIADKGLTDAVLEICMGGINRDGSITEIGKIFDVDHIDITALISTAPDILLAKLRSELTIYERLCAGDHMLPIKAFEPYKNDAYGMLMMKVTTAATANAGPENKVIFHTVYVEGSPSESPLTELAIDPRSTPIA
jgi:hypothetical protein